MANSSGWRSPAALVNDPALILADEPTGNLDPANAGAVLDLLAGLPGQGRTLVVVTHDPAVAARAGRVLRLERGRVAADEGRLSLVGALATPGAPAPGGAPEAPGGQVER